MAKSKQKTNDQFDKIKSKCQDLRDELAERDARNERLENMYNLVFSLQNVDPSVRLLVSPRPYNVVETGARLYATNPPTLQVIAPQENVAMKKAAAKIEEWCKALLHCNHPTRLTADLMRALLMFDECSILVLPRYQFEDDAEQPFDFIIPHPNQCYPQYHNGRLSAHLYRACMTWQDFKDTYGEEIAKKVDRTDTPFDDEDEVTVNDYVNKTMRGIWLDEEETRYHLVEHNLGFIPRASIIATAPTFITDTANNRKGILFPLDTAKIWEAECLLMTTANTNVSSYLNMNWIGKVKDPSQHKRDELRANATGQVFWYEVGEDVQPFPKTLLEPEHMQWLGQVNELAQISTFPNIIAGASPFSGITASATTTMSTNGRLIVQPFAAAAAELLRNAFTIAVKIATKESGKGKVSVYGSKGISEIANSDLQELGGKVLLDVTLSPDVSQERQLHTQMAQAVRGMGFGLDTTAQILEEGGVIRNSQEAVKAAMVDQYIQANVKQFAAAAAKESGLQDELPPEQEVPQLPGIAPLDNATMIPNPPQMAEEMGGMPADVGMV